MSVAESQALEETLRLIAEASSRAERAAREGEGAVAAAFGLVDLELRRLYKALLDGTVFAAAREAVDTQLELGAAA